MVLDKKPDTDAWRFIFGICIIAASIYVFYIGTALRNSPELFLKPQAIKVKGFSCTSVTSEGLTACIPPGIEFLAGGGGIELFSTKDRIRGSIKIIQVLPQERGWRASLKRPFMKMFIGNVDTIGTFELMVLILQHRYNPTLMGAKAALIPPWMKNTKGAHILILKEERGLIFYTPGQSLGLSFKKGATVMISMNGRIPPETAAGIMSSISLTTTARPKTGSKGSS
ncbi:MAG: hypothetical protein ACLQDF_13700 [Desulfomonilia bacterium]